jgi:capsule biosynthesis phosphatase
MIPMNGLGNRFRDEGYIMPKPLINVLGKPMLFWLLDGLNLNEVDEIIIPYTSVLDGFDFQNQLKDRYRDANFKFLPLSYPTRGAAETVQVALDNLDDSSLARPIMLLDCDTFYGEDIVAAYLKSTSPHLIFYFEDKQERPIYSYISITDGMVKDIAEKKKISDYANCGVYCFGSGSVLKEYCGIVLNLNLEQNGELYISSVYKAMIGHEEIAAARVQDFHCVGTPTQLKTFCEENKRSASKRFCFDLDGTLVTKPKVEGDYSTCDPIERNIRFLRHLKATGHHIIVFTARRMRTHGGNVPAVIKDIGEITLDQLRKFNIPYDEIQFGKPYAHFYIDDLAVDAKLSLEKQTGYYNSSIGSRSFNSVEILKTMVIKSGHIDGERYYYQRLQEDPKLLPVSRYFPAILESTDEKIIIERLSGLNFSYLYTNGGLTEQHLDQLMDALFEIHGLSCTDLTWRDAHKELINKVISRYATYNYSRFHNAKDTYHKIIAGLQSIKRMDAAATVIHGDPVFTNVIVTPENKIKLFDMRGKVGDRLTVGGDPWYDIAKVYQSILGYDFILNNMPVAVDQRLLDRFLQEVSVRYGITKAQLDCYTASMYFSLIPLHDNEKCEQYYQMARKLIDV